MRHAVALRRRQVAHAENVLCARATASSALIDGRVTVRVGHLEHGDGGSEADATRDHQHDREAAIREAVLAIRTWTHRASTARDRQVE